jgi:hypothetical protein
MDNTQRQLYIDAQNYFVGDGGRRQNRPHAIELLRQVCYDWNRPIPAAARMFANCLETGESVAMDLNEARRLYNAIGDQSGVLRCDRKIQEPGSHGHGAFDRAAAGGAAAPPSNRRHLFPDASVPPFLAAGGGRPGQVQYGSRAPPPRQQPRQQLQRQPLPTPLPLHIERIVVQVS